MEGECGWWEGVSASSVLVVRPRPSVCALLRLSSAAAALTAVSEMRSIWGRESRDRQVGRYSEGPQPPRIQIVQRCPSWVTVSLCFVSRYSNNWTLGCMKSSCCLRKPVITPVRTITAESNFRVEHLNKGSRALKSDG